MSPRSALLAGGLVVAAIASGSAADIDRFVPGQGGTTEVWRITNHPERRDWANYHNSEAWSPDGRYLCFTSSADVSEVHLFDLERGTDTLVDAGTQPRWANDHNWLFYLRPAADGGEMDVLWLDVGTGTKIRIGSGLNAIGETDSDDRWLFGSTRKGIVRVPIREDARVEDISAGGALGSFMIPNPRHPLVMFRGDSRAADGRDLPYAPTRVWSDLEGNHVVNASPMIQRCHQSWSGDGTYHLHGNSQVRGRRWDQPFPSNLEYLAAVDVHDVSSCGRSGRWVIGSGNIGPMPIADLRSGDGRVFLQGGLSFLHDSRTFSYSNGSARHDNDAKGSPDGTKVVLSSNYDLEHGPVTTIAADVPDPAADSIPVESTEGFPAAGRLSVQNEVIGYRRKTPTSFEGLTRQMYDTMPLTGPMLEDLSPERRALYVNRPDNTVQLDSSTDDTLKPYLNKPLYLSKGIIVTSFDARLVPQDRRKYSQEPARDDPRAISGRLRFHPAVAAPHRRVRGGGATPRPSAPARVAGSVRTESPERTTGRRRASTSIGVGRRVTDVPMRPGTLFTPASPGTYTASAVEWSGLESERSAPLALGDRTRVYIRSDKPGDFQWTSERWLVKGRPVESERAARAETAVREVVHLVEGVIHREWHTWGTIARRHDLNAEGQATRRLFYRDGVLERREYRRSRGRAPQHRALRTRWLHHGGGAIPGGER